MFAIWFRTAALVILLGGTGLSPRVADAADAGLLAGEAVISQFSGTAAELGEGQVPVTRIDPDGAVAKILDLRLPGFDPQGQHWLNEPQSVLATARQVGQVFGIAFDDAPVPNIYLSASSVSGLRRGEGVDDWMEGQWGVGGGPGSIWKLDAQNGYAPQLFATVTLDGRANSGAGLGNLAFDPYNRQLLVSDLETGMIHAIGVDDGVERDRFDHGQEGRSGFLDARDGQMRSLPAVPFDPASSARLADCQAPDLAAAPQCWNIADFRRRVWGLGVRRDGETGEIRLFYGLWSNVGFGNAAFSDAAQEEKTDSVWSVALNETGGFDRSSVRLEFLVPPEAGPEKAPEDAFAISDIAFPRTLDQETMLLGRHRGIITRDPSLAGVVQVPWPDTYWPEFTQSENQVWTRGPEGTWSPLEPDDDTAKTAVTTGRIGQNAAGGVDFGFGYRDGSTDENDPAGFIWLTANHLCSAATPCLNPATGELGSVSEVHGVIGLPNPAIAAGGAEPQSDAFLAIDIDVNVDAGGNVDIAQLSRRNAGAIGDIEIYLPYPELPAAPEMAQAGAVQEPAIAEGALWPQDAQDAPWWPPVPATPAPGPDAGPAPDMAPAAAGPDLAIQKAIPFACVPDAACTIVVIVTNVGDSDYASPIRISDTLANDWTLLAAGPAGTSWTCVQFGADAICDKPDFVLAPGAQDVLTFDVQVPAQQVPGVIHNCAVVDHAAGGIDANPANDQGCADIAFDGAGGMGGGGAPTDVNDLSIAKAALGDCVAGQPCPFTLTITNSGSVAFDGELSFVDVMPAGWVYASKDLGWWCMLTFGGGDRFSCHRQQHLDPGQSVDVSLAIRSPTGATGTAENCARITPSKTVKDDRPENDEACATVNLKPAGATITLAPVDLSIEKAFVEPALTGPTATATTGCKVGEACPFRFTVKITNVGANPYFGSVIFNDLLPLGWTYQGMSGAQICETKGGWLSCGFGPPIGLDPGESVSATIDIRSAPLEKPTTFSVRNCAGIAWQGKGDENAANDTACDELTVNVLDAQGQAGTAGMVQTPGQPTGSGAVIGPSGTAFDLSIDKSAPHAAMGAAAGAGAIHACGAQEPCQFSVTLTNVGPDAYSGPVTFEDKAPPGWAFASAGSGWNCAPGGSSTFSCSGNASLKTGESVSLDLFLMPMAGVPLQPVQQENCVEIAWTQGKADFNSANDRSCMPFMFAATAPATPGGTDQVIQPTGPDIVVRKTAATDSCEPGGECHFIITIEGARDVPFAEPFKVSDVPPKGWTFLRGGKLNLWNCSTSAQGDTACAYDIGNNPQMPAQGLTTADRIGFDIQFKVPANYPEGEVKNCVIITFESPAAGVISRENKVVCAFVQVAKPSKMEIGKAFDQTVCVPGKACDFSITVKNSGKGPYTGFLEVTDQFDKNMEVESYQNHSKWKCDLRDQQGQQVFSCKRFGPFPVGTTEVVLDANVKLKEDASVSEIENCGTLWLHRPNPASLSPEERVDLVRNFLEFEGFAVSEDSPELTEAEKQALVQYKTNHQDQFIDENGKTDVSGEITDPLLKLLLPKAEDDSDNDVIDGCSKVQVAKETEISIRKTGPHLLEALKTPTALYDEGCTAGATCTFLIEISGATAGVYDQPLAIEDRMPAGWKLVDYAEKSEWQCQGMGTNVVKCAYAGKPVDLTQPIALTLDAKLPPYFFNREVELENCAQIFVQQGNYAVASSDPKHRACIDFVIRHSDLSYGSSAYAMTATGTPTCAPPEPCSFYEFTARRTNEPDAAYVGPLKFTVTPPPGTRFRDMRFSKTPAACPASAWSCDRADSEFGGAFTCQAPVCAMSPGDEIAVRIDGSVAPNMTESPPEPIEKTACGELEWDGRPAGIDIEQLGNKRRAKACFTTTILPKPKPVPCPAGEERNAAGNCVPVVKPLDLSIAKRAIGDCSGQENCRFQITVSSEGSRPYNGRVAIRDTFSVSGAVMKQVSGRASCSQRDRNIDCVIEPEALAKGQSAVIALDMGIPHSASGGTFQNCAEIYQPDPDDTTKLSRDEVRMLQQALDHGGFNPGPIDGVIGSKTRSAARAARQSLGLPGTEVDRELLALLLGQQPEQVDTNTRNNRACATMVAPVCAPGYSVARTSGRCVCLAPRVERNGACVLPPPAPPKPERPVFVPPPPPPVILPTVRCENGRVDTRNVCVCPAGWTRERVGTNWYRCVKPQAPPPPPPVRCDGGWMGAGNVCVCPPNWTRERVATNWYRCVAPPPPKPVTCIGGSVVRGLCICPPGANRQPLAGGGFRCVVPPRPQPVPQPQPQPRPTIPQILPKLPQFQPILPKFICPPGQVFDAGAGRCVVLPERIR